jgi:hypothetical protein
MPQKETTDDVYGFSQSATELNREQKRRFCKLCGGPIDPQIKKCTSCGKQYFRFPKKAFLVATFTVMLLALAGLNIYQYTSYKRTIENNSSTIADLEKQIKTKDSTIATQKSTISSQRSEISELEDKADYYDDICAFLHSGNIGYAADNFKASDSVVLVEKSDTSKKITLTAYWSSGGSVSTSNSSFLTAGIVFDNDSWSRTTTMTIKPYSEGLSIITFSNDVDSKTFKIMIIVTD